MLELVSATALSESGEGFAISAAFGSVARSTAEALSELRRCAGGQFDPEVVAAFDRVLAARAAVTA